MRLASFHVNDRRRSLVSGKIRRIFIFLKNRVKISFPLDLWSFGPGEVARFDLESSGGARGRGRFTRKHTGGLPADTLLAHRSPVRTSNPIPAPRVTHLLPAACAAS